MISPDSIEALKARVDIVDVVGNYIELKKKGSSFSGLCPFHDEKSPSFSVNPQKQFFYCFGCQVGGDSINFVMNYEKLTYPEAIEKLAQEYNFTLHYTEKSSTRSRSKLLQRVQEFYSKELNTTPDALEYLRERGVHESSIESFGIGYAPSSQRTIGFLKQQHFSMAEAIELGALGRGENGNEYARFIERVTFAINAPNGSIVGWGGRTISGHVAKYVNSPQTAIFNKSKLLYAYDRARVSIYKHKQIIITEGYLDVVMLHQAGFTQAVATLGTALTPEHLPLLRKGEADVVMAYDGDKAGRAAALKASKMLSISGFGGGVVLFGDGVDPADMVKSGRVSELSSMFRSAKPFVEFVIDMTLDMYDLSRPDVKQKALQEVISYLKALSPLLQEEYKIYLSSKLGVSPSHIKIKNSSSVNMVESDEMRGEKDLQEQSFIKTVLEHPQSISMILDFIKPQMFKMHKDEFQKAITGDRSDPKVIEILLDDRISVLEDRDLLKREMIFFLRKHYEQYRKSILYSSGLDHKEKAFLNRKISGKITKLKRGELVGLDN